jgi:hypothetical protein
LVLLADLVVPFWEYAVRVFFDAPIQLSQDVLISYGGDVRILIEDGGLPFGLSYLLIVLKKFEQHVWKGQVREVFVAGQVGKLWDHIHEVVKVQS